MATKKATKTPAKSTAKKAAKAPAKPVAKKSVAESKEVKAATPRHVSHDEIASLAEQLWIERGRPHGSAHIDWHNAEQQLKG